MQTCTINCQFNQSGHCIFPNPNQTIKLIIELPVVVCGDYIKKEINQK